MSQNWTAEASHYSSMLSITITWKVAVLDSGTSLYSNVFFCTVFQGCSINPLRIHLLGQQETSYISFFGYLADSLFLLQLSFFWSWPFQTSLGAILYCKGFIGRIAHSYMYTYNAINLIYCQSAFYHALYFRYSSVSNGRFYLSIQLVAICCDFTDLGYWVLQSELKPLVQLTLRYSRVLNNRFQLFSQLVFARLVKSH